MILRRISLIALFIALAGLMVVPNSAQAQQETQPWEQDQERFTNLIDALNNIDMQARALENVQAREVEVVDVEEIRRDLDENQTQTLDEALQDAETNRDALHEALRGNQAITQALEEETQQEDVEIRDVVAVHMGEEGEVVVFYEQDDMMDPRGN